MQQVTTLHPFGTPEGTPDEEDPLKDFVPFSGRQFTGGLGMSDDDRRVRVVVGRKGAGKTLYLRRLQVNASGDRSLYADSWVIDHPHTRVVHRVFQWGGGPDPAADLWERLWKCAIVRSVVSHVLNDPDLRSMAGAAAVEDLMAFRGPLFRELYGKSSAYRQAQDLIYESDDGHGELATRRKLERLLDNPQWNALEQRLKEVLAELPPMLFYLDALDEHFERAPVQWLACQKGLCKQVLQLADQFPRLHVVISVRDLVFSALQASEHMTRYLRTDRIRTLDWNYSAVEYLLENKIANLPDDYLLLKDADDPVERWLGVLTIENEGVGRRRRYEPLKDYLLRHTRLIPRDLVQLGNALCDLINEAWGAHEACLMPHAIREVVKATARDAANEQLMIVANHITAINMPAEFMEWHSQQVKAAAAQGRVDDAGSSYQRGMRTKLKQLLGNLKRDRFSREELDAFAEAAAERFGGVNVPSALWQHGLLGFIEGPKVSGKAVFFGTTHDGSIQLPEDHKAYALHPILIDAVPGLRGYGEVVRFFPDRA